MEMKRIFRAAMWRRAVLALVVTAFLAAAPAFAADTVLANVPFAFKVGSKTLPAGDYSFAIREDYEVLAVRSTANPKGPSALEEIVTTLAPSNSPEARVVFDKVGGEYLLSEVWQPEGEGILVHTTKGRHEHHVVRGRKK